MTKTVASTLEVPSPAVAARTASQTRARLIAASVLGGLLLAVVWSFTLVDSTIGDNVADNLLGYDAKVQPIDGAGAGILFAFVSGLAGSFTACNIAGLSAVAPLSSQRATVGDVLRPLGWLAASACSVAGLYGALGALIGDGIPQLSDATVGALPARILQATVVFGVIGLVLAALGLGALRVVPDVMGAIERRHSRGPVVVVGALMGGFLIGRPFPLFHKMFAYAASTHDPLFGAGAFVLQALGNMTVMGGVFLALSLARGGAFPRWLQARPSRVRRFTASAFLVAGTFTFAYWVIRVPAAFGIGWWPSMPWS